MYMVAYRIIYQQKWNGYICTCVLEVIAGVKVRLHIFLTLALHRDKCLALRSKSSVQRWIV